jgi:hypothetical protein
MVSSGDVACVRDGSPDELREVAPLRRFCSTAAKPNATPFPENSIASYAVRMLGCAPENFTGNASAWVVRFPHDEPRKLDPKAEFTETSWSMPAAFLTLPGLQGLRMLPQKLDRSQGSLRERLRNETPSSVWVLGFANTRGPAGHNLNLSERRAMRLRQVLEADVPTEAHRIKTRGLSEDTFAGMFGAQETETDRVAVAFFCRPMQ